MITLEDERLKEIEKSEYNRLHITRINNPLEEVTGRFELDDDYNDDEIRGFVYGKIMSVFSICHTDGPRIIYVDGFMHYNHKDIKELLEEIDPHIESGSLSFRDCDAVQHEITLIKYGKDDRWHYQDTLILLGSRKFLFEEDNE